MDAAFADDGLVGEFRRRLAHKRNIGPVGHAAIDGGAGMRERGRGDVASDGEGVADVLDRRAIGHDEHAFFLERAHGVFKRLAVGSRAVGGIHCDDVGARRDARARVPQRRGDVNALVAFLPNADDGHLGTSLDGGDVGEPLAADSAGTAELAGARHLSHSLRVTQGFAHIGLAAYDEFPFELLDNGIDHEMLLCDLRDIRRVGCELR